MRLSGSLKRWVEKCVAIFKMAPAGLDNKFRSLMFNVHVLSGTRFYWFFNKGGNKVEANRLKNKTQKNLLGLWRRAFGQSLAVFFVLFCCGCFLGGGRWGVGSGVGMGVWAFSWCLVDWNVVKRACCLEKKQSFMNSVIEILLKVKNNHRSKFFFEILLIRNSSFTLLLKWLETLLFRLI